MSMPVRGGRTRFSEKSSDWHFAGWAGAQGQAAQRGPISECVREVLRAQPGFYAALLLQATHSHPTPASQGGDDAKTGAAACAGPIFSSPCMPAMPACLWQNGSGRRPCRKRHACVVPPSQADLHDKTCSREAPVLLSSSYSLALHAFTVLLAATRWAHHRLNCSC